MIKQIVEFSKQVLALTKEVQKCRTDITEIRQYDREQDQRIDQLVEAVRTLTYELKHDRDMSARDRENLVLRLENELLRFERRLPPAPTSGTPDSPS
jgi:hypothetical protein